jgi:hypothetical protein
LCCAKLCCVMLVCTQAYAMIHAMHAHTHTGVHMRTGFEKRDAKLTFCWSQMAVTDELRRRKRAVALTPFDLAEVWACVHMFVRACVYMCVCVRVHVFMYAHVWWER